MAKFYIQSGPKFSMILGGPHLNTAEEAAIEAIQIGARRQSLIADNIIVSERGFDFYSREVDRQDYLFQTEEILQKAGF